MALVDNGDGVDGAHISSNADKTTPRNSELNANDRSTTRRKVMATPSNLSRASTVGPMCCTVLPVSFAGSIVAIGVEMERAQVAR